jgi:NADH dehydrogenase/putative oxidoreductase
MMSEATERLRQAMRLAAGLGQAVELLSMPWLLLAGRLWLGQVALVRVMRAMMIGGTDGWPNIIAGGPLASTLGSGIESVFPVGASLLLMTGLLTRPVALALLLGAALPSAGQSGVVAQVPTIALLAWLLASGPGPLSLDGLFRRGLAWSAFGPAKTIAHLYAVMTSGLRPIVQLLARMGLAVLVAVPALPMLTGRLAWLGDPTLPAAPPVAWPLALALALVVGVATRPVGLVLAGAIPLSGITMTTDHRLTVLLVCLTIAAAGAGRYSVDRLIELWARRGQSDRESTGADLPHVVVVGGGFGGVAAARGLRHARCRVTLVDRRNHHLFQPLLYQVATAALSPAEIATPIRSLFRQQRNVRVRFGEVTGIDTAARDVLLGSTRIGFDYLVLATGARHSYFGQDSWAGRAPGLKSIEDATDIRSRLLRAFEEAENAMDEAERAAWLTFVVVGGGPTGVELAGAIAELARHGMDREYRTIDPATAQVILVQSGPRVLPTFTSALSVAAESSLRDLGVDVRLDARVQRVDDAGVTIGEQCLAARTVLWAAGVAASPATRWLDRPGDAAGRVIVGPDLSIEGLSGIYAVGDTAACHAWNGGPVPGLAPAAKQAGRHVARVIRAAVLGRPPPPAFRYRHYGSLATIGRQAAVVELGWIRLSGAIAWWFWGAAHVAFLVGGRNRTTVILDWLWAYLTYRRSTRLITGNVSPRSTP